MIKRVLWVGLGVAIGVMAVRKVTETKQRFGPEGLNRAVGSFTDGVANFTDALREGTREREADLRLALGLDDAGKGAERPADAGTRTARTATHR